MLALRSSRQDSGGGDNGQSGAPGLSAARLCRYSDYMASPISFDLPHRLGKAEARNRLANGLGSLERHIPGGAQVNSGWEGDRLNMQIAAMGQEIRTTIEVFETHVRLELVLPPMLSFFGKQIENVVRKETAELLEDRNKN